MARNPKLRRACILTGINVLGTFGFYPAVGNRPRRRSREFREPFSALWLNPHQETGKSGSLPSFTLSAPWEVVCHFLHSVITVSRLFASGYRPDDPITRRFSTRFHAFTRH